MFKTKKTYKRSKKVYKRFTLTEHDLQCMITTWARVHEREFPALKWLHSSINGVKLSMPQAIKAKASGMKRGIPDLCLPFPSMEFTQLFIELKVGKNKQTPEQIEFMDFVVKGGAFYSVCYSYDEAIETLKKYVTHCRFKPSCEQDQASESLALSSPK